MTCPITVHLGVYALGAGDTAERMLVASHLPSCPACQAELAGLEPLPGLLARLPAHLVRTDPRPARPKRAPVARIFTAGSTPARRVRASAGRWRVAAAVAAAAALGAAGGVWIAQPAPSPAPAGVTLSAANPVTHVRVTVTLTETSWGTSIRLLARGLPLNQPCRLIVRSRDGGTEVAGAWDAWRTGPVSIPASAGWRPADIASLQVATTSRSLVTITAARASAGARTAQPPSPPRR
jgi:anti-sigma-K factor RskA